MTTLLNGLLGGLIVGGLAALAARLVAEEPSATAAVLEAVAGVRESSSRRAAFAAQLLYGGLAGGALVALELYALGALGVPPSVGEAMAVAVAWSAALFAVAALVWRAARPGGSDRPFLRELLAYHLVFGVGLGAWIRLTWIT